MECVGLVFISWFLLCVVVNLLGPSWLGVVVVLDLVNLFDQSFCSDLCVSFCFFFPICYVIFYVIFLESFMQSFWISVAIFLVFCHPSFCASQHGMVKK